MEVYNGESKSIQSYLDNDYYFFIPEYQRDYIWSDDNIEDLFCSVRKGLNTFKIDKDKNRQRESSTYLGCIIDWLRSPLKSDMLAEHNNKTYIDNVRELIDGQQRTSTFSLLSSRLFVKFEELLCSINLSSEGKKIARAIIIGYSEPLLRCIARYDSEGDNPRPFLIRQGLDQWSISDESSYTSPLTKYLNQFIIYTKTRPNEMLLDIINFPSSEDQNLKAAIASCDNSIEEITNTLDGINYIDTKFKGGELFKELYSGFDMVDLKNLEDQSNRDVVVRIVNLAAFTKYWLNYCFITIITSPSEEKSLDIFQQINSTGTQLSAFDLVKPLISRCYRDEGLIFNKSSTFELFNNIDKWLKLNSNIGGKRKHSNTRTREFFEILIHYFDVDGSPSELIEQRKIIRNAFTKFIDCESGKLAGKKNSEKAEEFCERLHAIKDYLDFFKLNNNFSDYSFAKKNKYNLFMAPSNICKDSFEDVAGFNFLFLLKTNHSICNAFLAHFYYEYVKSNYSNSGKLNLESAINICAIYFSIYRLIGDKYPDSFWQSFYTDNQIFKAEGNSQLLKLLLNSYNTTTKELGFFDFKNKESFKSKSTIAKNTFYNGRKNSLIKYLLLISTDSTTPYPRESKDCGLLKRNTKGAKLLTPEYWLTKDNSTLEHVAPQQLVDTMVENWSSELVGRSDIVNNIGNLTLLKKEINSSIQTNYLKKTEVFSRCFDNSFNIDDGDNTSKLTKHCQMLVDGIDKQHHLKPVALKLHQWLIDGDVENQWSISFIEKRALNIADLYVERSISILKSTQL